MSDAPTNDDAIASALRQDWKNAISINKKILERDSTNIDATNRLGFAYMKSGQLILAKRSFQKTITLDAYNQIALKNMEKLSAGKKVAANHVSPTTPLSPLMFLEEPGKTKIVNCVNPAPSKALAGCMCGQEVLLKPKRHCVEIRDESDTYLGALPDDVSFKLIRYLAAGNTYQVHIKAVGKKHLTVFLREKTRGRKFASQPSFISTAPYISAVKADGTDAVDRPDVSATGEADGENPAMTDHS